MTTYYIDSASDGGDGTTTATTGAQAAFKTIAAAQAAVTGDQHGNSLLFNKGNTWREQFTVGANGTVAGQFTIGSYGSGDKPKIYGSTAVITWDQNPLQAAGSKDIVNETFNATVGGTNHFTTAGTGHLDNTGWTGTLSAGSTLDADSTDVADPLAGSSEILKIQKALIDYDSLAVWDSGSTRSVTFSQVWIYVSAEGLANADQMPVFWTTTTGGANAPWRVKLNQSGSNLNFQLYIYNNGSETLHATSATIITGGWYRLEVKYDATGGTWGFKVSGTAVGSGTLTGTLYNPPRYWQLGSLQNFTAILYYDEFCVSTDNYQTVDSLPSGTWKAASATPEAVWFVANTTGVVTWGKKETVITNVNAEYDWYHDGTYLVVYAATTPDTRYASVEAGTRDAGITASADNTKQYITIDGFEIRYTNKYGVQSGVESTGWIITNNSISYIGPKNGSTSDGIRLKAGSSTISGNTISNIGTHGIYVVTAADAVIVDGTVIEYNTISDCFHTLIDVMNIHGTLTNTTIRKNSLDYTTDYDSTVPSNGIYISGDTAGHEVNTVNISYNKISNIVLAAIKTGGAAGTEKNINIDNNTIYERLSTQTTAATSGIHLVSTMDGTGTNNVRNNIIVTTLNDTSSYLLYLGDGDDFASVSNNLLYRIGGTGTVYVNVAAGTGAGSYHSDDQAAYITAMTGVKALGTLFADPLFQSATDLRLKPTSPAINAGVDVGLTTDYSGRPIQLLPDMGAYEYEIRRKRVK